jgi:hypothetical protein
VLLGQGQVLAQETPELARAQLLLLRVSERMLPLWQSWLPRQLISTVEKNLDDSALFLRLVENAVVMRIERRDTKP